MSQDTIERMKYSWEQEQAEMIRWEHRYQGMYFQNLDLETIQALTKALCQKS